MCMKAEVVIEKNKSKKCLSIYVDDRRKVNELMIVLIDAGFPVNYEPRYRSNVYEGCFLCGDESVIKICHKDLRTERK